MTSDPDASFPGASHALNRRAHGGLALSLAVVLGGGLLSPACGLETGGLSRANYGGEGGTGGATSGTGGTAGRIDAAVIGSDPESPPAETLDGGQVDARPAFDVRTDSSLPAPLDGGIDTAAPDRSPPDRSADAMTPDTALPPLPPGIALNRGMVYYTRLDDGPPSFTARDEASPPNLVSLQDLDVRSAWVEGRFGTALELSGGAGGGWLRVDDSPSLNSISSGLTVTAWIFLRNPASAGTGVIAGRRASGPGGFLYGLQLSNGHLRIRINSANGYNADHQSISPVPGGRWVHVAVTYDLNQTRFFVDGTLAGGGIYLHLIGPEISPLTVGAGEIASNVASDRLAGTLDEVIIYNRALAADEVGALARGYRPAAR